MRIFVYITMISGNEPDGDLNQGVKATNEE